MINISNRVEHSVDDIWVKCEKDSLNLIDRIANQRYETVICSYISDSISEVWRPVYQIYE